MVLEKLAARRSKMIDKRNFNVQMLPELQKKLQETTLLGTKRGRGAE